MLLIATLGDDTDRCRKTCQHLPHANDTGHRSPSRRMAVDRSHYSFEPLQLACSIGGIVGLYLGYSLFDALDLCHSLVTTHVPLKVSAMTSKRSSQLYRVSKSLICIAGAVLALCQFHTFLMNHEISSTIKLKQINNRSEQLSLTVCRWPPLSLSHVTELLGVNTSESQQEPLKVLESLPGNWSTTLDEIWDHAAWNISDVINAIYLMRRDGVFFSMLCNFPDCQSMWTPVVTPLNRCFSFDAVNDDVDIVELLVLFPDELREPNNHGFDTQIYFTVHPSNQPPLVANMLPWNRHKRNAATFFTSKYETLDQQQETEDDEHWNNTSHNSCVYECLSEGATRHLGCRLPYMVWRPDLLPCDQDQYRVIPSFFKGLEGIGKGSWDELRGSGKVSRDLLGLRERCYVDCRHLKATNNVLTVDDTVYDRYGMLVVDMTQEEEMEVIEEDHYTVSQLLSDLGGIAGTTAGISLMFVLKDLIPRLMTTVQRHR